MKILGFNIANTQTGTVSVENLRSAIHDNKLCLNYFPLIDVKSKKVIQLEALLRWPQKGDKFIAPMDFIPFAVEHQLMPELSRWIIRTACAQIRRWRDHGLELKLTINLSSENFSDLALVDFIKELISEYQLVPDVLGFEVPQKAIEDNEKAFEFIPPLENTGVRIVLDNVRSESLESLPEDCEACNTLKIDHSLIMGMLHDEAEISVVQSIIKSANKRDLKVVAPGVFSKQVWDLIGELGCQYAQGFYLSPPQAASDLDIWFRMCSWKPGVVDNKTFTNSSAI